MANSTIPNLVAVTVPALTDLFGVRQSGDSRDKKLTVTQLLTLIPSGGDVSKVGTPVDDQIGVWTGDGTIEGVPTLRYNSSLELFADSIVLGDLESVKIRETLVNTIAFRFSNSDRWRMNNDSFATSVSDGAFMKRTGVSGSVPSLVPRSGDENTGIGSAANDQISIVAGGIAAISVTEAASAIVISLVGTTRGTIANGFALINENASATNPTLIPNRAEEDTGIGQNASDEISLIGGGVELARAVAPASGGLLANNTLTGAGIERVLTVSDIGGGDVTKVGTPVDNQIGVWTGDGTIEGDAQFLWDGSALTVGFTNAGPQLLNEVASETNPTIVPTRNDTDTGIGHDAADRMAIIAGGVTVAHVQESAGAPAFIIDPNDAGAGAPELGFGPGGDTGWRESADVLTLILGGASKWGWDGDLYVSITATGAGLLNEAVSATNPTFVPNRSDLDSGIGQNAVDQVSIIAGGIEIARAVEDTVEQFIISPGALLGTAALPSLAFGDGDTGFRESFADTIKVGLAGVDRWTFTADRFVAVAGNGPSLQNEASTATNPTIIPALGDVTTGIGGVTGGLNIIVQSVSAMQFDEAGGVITIRAEGIIHGFLGTVTAPSYAFRLDSNTGMYSGGAGSDELKFSAGGVEALSLNELNSGVIQAHQANVAITAFATGGQASATQLDESYNVITTVATTGDSVKLPPVFAVNSVVYIKNNGANAADVFPATGDNLGAGLNTAVSLAAGESASFIATVASATWTPWIVSVGGGGGGDVTKVGTPVNNQIGVWTGDGTIEGDTGLIWDGSVLTATRLRTGAGSAASPAHSFSGDPDTGFYSVVPGIMAASVNGTDIFRFVGAQFRGATGGSPSIQNEVTSATNPTLLPSQADLDTGIGRTGTDHLALIAGALDCITIRETGGARQIGFYTTAPISLQTGVAVTAGAIHAALVALGLITA